MECQGPELLLSMTRFPSVDGIGRPAIGIPVGEGLGWFAQVVVRWRRPVRGDGRDPAISQSAPPVPAPIRVRLRPA